MIILRNYIDGQLIDPVKNEFLDNIEPATGNVFSKLPDSDSDDVNLAVNAANKAFESWSLLTREKRSNILLKIAELIDEKTGELAKAESIDNGKPISLAESVDIPRASANFRFFATAILHFDSEAHPMDNVAINYTNRLPIGVAGCISPWNLPLYLFTWKIAPALAAGNCVVAKPSELTPYTAYLLSEICIEAGLPPGVLNVVHGLGGKVGEAIVSHRDVPMISFTGGTDTGKRIASIAGPMFKKLSLELGGKNPNIIFADCDFEDALKTSIHSSFSNQGQICLCGSRIFIEASIYDKFKKHFVEKVKKLVVGDPMDSSTRMGAVVSKQHFEKILGYISLAKEEGGSIIAGGNLVSLEGRCKGGYFIQPTVIEGLPFDCRTNQEEIFGPVVTLIPFESEQDVIAMANSTPYGLSATIWTSNISKAHNISKMLKSGIVWVNCWLVRDLRTPFGGMKQSGVGREGGKEALRFFTETQNICIKL